MSAECGRQRFHQDTEADLKGEKTRWDTLFDSLRAQTENPTSRIVAVDMELAIQQL